MSELQAFLPDLEWHSQHGEFSRPALYGPHDRDCNLLVAASRTRNWLMLSSTTKVSIQPGTISYFRWEPGTASNAASDPLM